MPQMFHPARKKARVTYGNRFINQGRRWPSPQPISWGIGWPRIHAKGAGIAARPELAVTPQGLRVEDSHDLKRLRIDHHDLVANQDELVAAPFRIDRHDFRRERMEGD